MDARACGYKRVAQRNLGVTEQFCILVVVVVTKIYMKNCTELYMLTNEHR